MTDKDDRLVERLQGLNVDPRCARRRSLRQARELALDAAGERARLGGGRHRRGRAGARLALQRAGLPAGDACARRRLAR